ncbi:DUF934 domain-containing protein [Halovulum sp. GXIMD14794]
MTQIVTREGFVPETWPETGVIVSFDSLWNGQDLPIERPIGVRLEVDSDPADLVPWFDTMSMIVVPFPKSADGRGFSLAKRLRQLGYAGTIRAEGHVLVDQFRAALRVGIDQVAIPDDQAARNPEGQWLAVPHFDGYQTRLFAAE